jgi:hypothetical protein
MDQTVDTTDPHVEIVRLEAHIEELAARLESCRKFMLAARIAMILGALLLGGLLLGVVRFDPLALTAAIAAILGGFVVSGSNASTAQQATEQIAAAERDRAAMIGLLDLRAVGQQAATLH